MNRHECQKILKDKNNPQYKELHHIYWINYNNAVNFFCKPKDCVIHHFLCSYNDEHYEEWNINYVCLMDSKEHLKYHKKIKPPRLGIPFSKESLEKISNSLKGKPSPNKGKSCSEETKEKIREARKKQIMYPRSEETKEKIRQSLINHSVNSETRKKQSDSHKGKKGHEAWNKGKKKYIVMCVETEEILLNQYSHIQYCHIIEVCRGIRKTAGGFHWKFVDNQISSFHQSKEKYSEEDSL
jgi:hypothetical protein